jgi:hypothetical protein
MESILGNLLNRNLKSFYWRATPEVVDNTELENSPAGIDRAECLTTVVPYDMNLLNLSIINGQMNRVTIINEKLVVELS